ncbi:hypothetical protein C1645_820768 [Glomus cerebriforme]|uniref:Uncharacterized protein n=1 Tax=Glomus cerebriforme TaxID=658196 RepID=A0A397T695_9GLOM|nr:hypothetical protein C1645_820768 [Glomus cerebriforme]
MTSKKWTIETKRYDSGQKAFYFEVKKVIQLDYRIAKTGFEMHENLVNTLLQARYDNPNDFHKNDNPVEDIQRGIKEKTKFIIKSKKKKKSNYSKRVNSYTISDESSSDSGSNSEELNSENEFKTNALVLNKEVISELFESKTSSSNDSERKTVQVPSVLVDSDTNCSLKSRLLGMNVDKNKKPSVK